MTRASCCPCLRYAGTGSVDEIVGQGEGINEDHAVPCDDAEFSADNFQMTEHFTEFMAAPTSM